VLGFGDFYYELGVQIVEACLATRPLNGGLMEMKPLMRFVNVRPPCPRCPLCLSHCKSTSLPSMQCWTFVGSMLSTQQAWGVYGVHRKHLEAMTWPFSNLAYEGQRECKQPPLSSEVELGKG